MWAEAYTIGSIKKGVKAQARFRVVPRLIRCRQGRDSRRRRTMGWFNDKITRIRGKRGLAKGFPRTYIFASYGFFFAYKEGSNYNRESEDFAKRNFL